MNRLTPLERELMRSVTALADGSRKELDALRSSLKDYDANVTSSIEARLNEIERVQMAQSRLLSELEAQQREAWGKLTAILQGFTERLKASETQLRGYETVTRSLNEALGRLAK